MEKHFGSVGGDLSKREGRFPMLVGGFVAAGFTARPRNRAGAVIERTLTLSVLILLASRTISWAQTPEGRTASLNGMEMYYEVQGDGAPLVLLHGFGGAGEVWNRLWRNSANTTA